jgi:hypothetical protein
VALLGLSFLPSAVQDAAAAAPAPAASSDADGMGGYTSLRLDQAGVFVGTFDGKIESLSDGVKITLLSNDPEKKPLPISANQMKFSWPEGGSAKKPSRILLEGKVVIEHPQAKVRAEKADWDFDKGLLTFTGDPVMSSEQVEELQGEKIVLNFKENRFQVFGGRAKVINLQPVAEGGPSGSSLLQESDITDWAGFIGQIKSQGAAAGPSPGKQVLSLLEPQVQKLVTTVAAETLIENKGKLLKQVNHVITSPRLYNADAWKGVELAPEIQALAGQANLSAPDQMRLNRALIEAAFPGMVSKKAP